MKSFYRIYKDELKQHPTEDVICVFSENELPLRDKVLPINLLTQTYHCVVSDRTFGEPAITTYALAYLIAWCKPITEEDATSLDPQLAQLLKSSKV